MAYLDERSKAPWPLVPSSVFPGEKTLACGGCGSRDVTLTVRYPFRGTGPMGRGRMGDVGSKDIAVCRCCKQTAVHGRESLVVL